MANTKPKTKEELLKVITKVIDDNETDLLSDADTDMMFHDIDMKIGLAFDLEEVNNGDDYWLQVSYYSEKVHKTIIWSHEVGNFDDGDEVADFIINTEMEIADFEAKLPQLNY